MSQAWATRHPAPRHPGNVMRPLLALCLAALSLTACDDDTPCTRCPTLAGTYPLMWSNGVQQDGCSVKGPQPTTVTFTQNQAAIGAVVDGEALSGTLYASQNFVLHAGNTDRDLTLRGFITELGKDAGASISGSLTVQTSGKTTCSTSDQFNGRRP